MIWVFTTIIAVIPIIIFQPYRFKRIIGFLDPWEDPAGGGFQLIASHLAFSKGGLFGLGLGSSVQKLFYLPEQYNDFIFAIIAEELGFSDTTGELMDKVEILRPKPLNLIKYLKTKDS